MSKKYECTTDLSLSEFEYIWNLQNYEKLLLDGIIKSPSFSCPNGTHKFHLILEKRRIIEVDESGAEIIGPSTKSNVDDMAEGCIITLVYEPAICSNAPIVKIGFDLYVKNGQKELQKEIQKNYSELGKGWNVINHRIYEKQMTQIKAVIKEEPHDTNVFPAHEQIKNSKSVTEALFSLDILHDISLVIGGKEVKAHKCVLGAVSDVWRRMFMSDCQEVLDSKIEIKDFDFETVRQAVKFIYRRNYKDFNKKSLGSLLLFGDKYHIPLLCDVVEMTMIEELTTKNAIEYLNIADRTHKKRLRDAALKLMISL